MGPQTLEALSIFTILDKPVLPLARQDTSKPETSNPHLLGGVLRIRSGGASQHALSPTLDKWPG
jgi:hypothetical protein